MQRNSTHTFREVEYTMTITRNKIKFQKNFLRKYKYIQYQQISINFRINFFADIKVGYSTCSIVTMSSTTFRRIFSPNIGTIFRINFFPNNKVGYIMVTISSKAFRSNFFPNIGTNFRITFFHKYKRMHNCNNINYNFHKNFLHKYWYKFRNKFLPKYKRRTHNGDNVAYNLQRNFLPKYLVSVSE